MTIECAPIVAPDRARRILGSAAVDRGTSIRLIERVVILWLVAELVDLIEGVGILGPVALLIEGTGMRLTAPLLIEGVGMRLTAPLRIEVHCGSSVSTW